MENNEAEYLYYKGKILNHLAQPSEAMLIMEQILGTGVQNQWSIKALYYIAKIRAKQKNFYEAYHTLNRLPEKVEDEKVKVFKKLIEGVDCGLSVGAGAD